MPVREPLPLLQTVLHRPRVAHGPILRPHLFELLDAGKDDALTLVSAPPGYGKSVLLTTWLADRKLSFGWISLDDNDNGPEIYIHYLVGAIQKQHPKACQKIASLLSNVQLPNLPHLASHLTEEISACKEPVLLILDDYHLIRNEEIAERLFIAPGTVKRHANTVCRKLNVHSRRDAAAKARGLGFLAVE